MDVPTWLRQEGGDSTAERESDGCTDNFLKKGRTVQLGGNLEVPDDGFSWLKYGQKHIRGTQNRRNYYRCSQHRELGCPAKKTIDFRPSDPSELCITQAEAHNHPPRTTPPNSKHLFFLPLPASQTSASMSAENISRTISSAAARGQAHLKRNFPSSVASVLPNQQQQQIKQNNVIALKSSSNISSKVETNTENMEYTLIRGSIDTDSSSTKKRKTDFGANSPSAASSGITTDAPESVHPYRTTSTGSTLCSARDGTASPKVLENSSQVNYPKCTDFQIPSSTDCSPPTFANPADITPSFDQNCMAPEREIDAVLGRGRGGEEEGDGAGGEGGEGGKIIQRTEIHMGRLGCASATSDLDCILGPASSQWMAQGEQNVNWSSGQEFSHFSEEASSTFLWDSFLAEIIRGEDSTNEVSPLGFWETTTSGHVAGGLTGGGLVAGEGEGEELPYLIQSMESGISDNGALEDVVSGMGVFGNGVSENGILGNMFFGNGVIGNGFSGNGVFGNTDSCNGVFGSEIYCGSVPPDGALLEIPLPPVGDMGGQLLTSAVDATWQDTDVAQPTPMLWQQLLTSSLPGRKLGRTQPTWMRCLGV